jgi:hypothetical protein
MTGDLIKISYSLTKEDLICCVCLGELEFPIIGCSNGSHFVCSDCFGGLRSRCPTCRTGFLFHNRFLESQLQSHLVPCENAPCERRLLPWSVDDHRQSCRHTEAYCFLCSREVSLDTMMEHIKTKCGAEWFERRGEVMDGTCRDGDRQHGSE